MAVSPVSLSSRTVGGPPCTVNLEEGRMSSPLELAVLLHMLHIITSSRFAVLFVSLVPGFLLFCFDRTAQFLIQGKSRLSLKLPSTIKFPWNLFPTWHKLLQFINRDHESCYFHPSSKTYTIDRLPFIIDVSHVHRPSTKTPQFPRKTLVAALKLKV